MTTKNRPSVFDDASANNLRDQGWDSGEQRHIREDVSHTATKAGHDKNPAHQSMNREKDMEGEGSKNDWGESDASP